MIEGKFYQRNVSDLLEVLGVTDEVLSQLSAFPGKLEHAQNGRTVARNSNSLNTYYVLTYYSIYIYAQYERLVETGNSSGCKTPRRVILLKLVGAEV